MNSMIIILILSRYLLILSRVTTNSKTLVDNIFSNMVVPNIMSGNLTAQPSGFTLAVGSCEGFAEANSIFIVIILPRGLFPSNIHIQFTIFNTYFSAKLSFTNKRYHLHVLEKCLYVLQEVRSIIYFRQLIHPFLFGHVAVEQALLSSRISSYRRNSVTSHF